MYYLKLSIKVLDEAVMDANVLFLVRDIVMSLICRSIFSPNCLCNLEYWLLRVSGRFRAPISSDECRRFEDSWVSDASRRKWNWVLNIFEEWRETRNEAVLKVENSGEPVLNQRIDEMSDEDLDFFLGRFVAEVRKEDGQEYPGKTIYEMICSLQCYLRFQRKGPLVITTAETKIEISYK